MNLNAWITVTLPSSGLRQLPEQSKVFRIDSSTLHHYLPRLPLTPRIDAHHLIPPPNRDQHTHKALLYLFTHIAEVSHHGTSGALLQSLETSYKRTSNRTPSTTTSIVDRLAYLLRRYGAHPSLSSALSTFFTRHCDAMIRRRPLSALMCLRALSALGAPMDSVLACVASPRRNVGTLLSLAARVAAREHTRILPSEVQDTLLRLVGQKERREEQERGIVCTRGGTRIPRTLLCGDELALEDLQAIWAQEGYRIKVDVTGGEHLLDGGGYDDEYGYGDDGYYDDGWYGDDGYDDDDDDYYYYGSESDDSLYDVFARRARPPYLQPQQRPRRRLEGRRQPSLAWRGPEMQMGMGGYGDGLESEL
ncbi:hypothetical protein MMC17_001762 [Xylographa soralifera]|nr:hypothetical protein [Xylographa soralifera]